MFDHFVGLTRKGLDYLNFNFFLLWTFEEFSDACDDWKSVVTWILNTDVRISLFIVFAVDFIGVKGTTNQDASWNMYLPMSVDCFLRREVYSTGFAWPWQFPPFLRHPPLDPACLSPPPPFLKSLFPLSSFLFLSLFKYFRQFPLPQATLLPYSTNQPSLHIINRFKQISKGWFYQFNCCFL